MLVLFFLFLISKSKRLIFFLLSLEILLLGLMVYYLFLVNFYVFFMLGILGVVSSIGCLVLFLKIVVNYGNDMVYF